LENCKCWLGLGQKVSKTMIRPHLNNHNLFVKVAIIIAIMVDRHTRYHKL